ncbi:MAG TPA: 50S ribosomal protein L7/L12 [Aggregatilineales bacterium]|jgi:large subunit ribosomal protein L7/L12|nr:50S ribosomal protein L7/L12 [Aggregatilineales bacterium]
MADLNKLVEELSALTILEAAELKTLLEEKWGVTAASGGGMMMMAGAMPGAAAAPAEEVEEQTEFDLILEDAGPKKIEVIKVVRALTNLGLKEAKDAVEQTPTTVLEAKDKATVEDAKKKLEEVGAKVKVK